MFTFIGIAFGLLAIIGGYLMHQGNLMALLVPSEYVIVVGSGAGILLASNGMSGFLAAIKGAMGVLKPDPYTKATFTELLRMMYQLFNVARKEGLLGLEKHIERPEESEIIRRYPSFLANHHARAFFCDTMKVVLTGAVGPHDLSEMMELDLEIAHKEAHRPSDAMQNLGDAFPAIGIIAAVLGVIITMGKIDQGAAVIGRSVAAALTGTMLGILIAYVICYPISRSMAARLKGEEQYMNCIRFALFSFARGESPITCVEFARRNIEPTLRPGFVEMEKAVKQAA
jgi:chemotaxis protein MotA